MNDNIIEIYNDAINVEQIMEKIQENIRRRQVAGEGPPYLDTEIGSSSENCIVSESDNAIQRDLSYINANWDMHNNSYFISSHHPYFGKFLIKGRQMVHGEVQRYVDPIFSRQTRFNASTVRLLFRTFQIHAELENAISRLKQETDQNIKNTINTAKSESDLKSEELESKFETRAGELESKFETRAGELESKFETRAGEFFSQLDADMHSRVSLVHVLEDRIQKGGSQKSTDPKSMLIRDTNYFLFEERFRGSREDIKHRQVSFLPYFEKCSNVLDIGCGRGEFLEIIRDKNITGIGVDIDADMIAYCRSRHLHVEQSDAIMYLEKLEDKSLDGIFIDQVVEHLEPEYIFRLLALCYQKLKFGYYIVVETVNPQSFISFVNFYIDLTHKRPLHPQTLQFLICAAGFRESEKKFFSPVSDESKLKTITDTSGLDAVARKNIDTYNNNIERLNSVLFGEQDYAVIAKK